MGHEAADQALEHSKAPLDQAEDPEAEWVGSTVETWLR